MYEDVFVHACGARCENRTADNADEADVAGDILLEMGEPSWNGHGKMREYDVLAPFRKQKDGDWRLIAIAMVWLLHCFAGMAVAGDSAELASFAAWLSQIKPPAELLPGEPPAIGLRNALLHPYARDAILRDLPQLVSGPRPLPASGPRKLPDDASVRLVRSKAERIQELLHQWPEGPNALSGHLAVHRLALFTEDEPAIIDRIAFLLSGEDGHDDLLKAMLRYRDMLYQLPKDGFRRPRAEPRWLQLRILQEKARFHRLTTADHRLLAQLTGKVPCDRDFLWLAASVHHFAGLATEAAALTARAVLLDPEAARNGTYRGDPDRVTASESAVEAYLEAKDLPPASPAKNPGIRRISLAAEWWGPHQELLANEADLVWKKGRFVDPETGENVPADLVAWVVQAVASSAPHPFIDMMNLSEVAGGAALIRLEPADGRGGILVFAQQEGNGWYAVHVVSDGKIRQICDPTAIRSIFLLLRWAGLYGSEGEEVELTRAPLFQLPGRFLLRAGLVEAEKSGRFMLAEQPHETTFGAEFLRSPLPSALTKSRGWGKLDEEVSFRPGASSRAGWYSRDMTRVRYAAGDPMLTLLQQEVQMNGTSRSAGPSESDLLAAEPRIRDLLGRLLGRPAKNLTIGPCWLETDGWPATEADRLLQETAVASGCLWGKNLWEAIRTFDIAGLPWTAPRQGMWPVLFREGGTAQSTEGIVLPASDSIVFTCGCFTPAEGRESFDRVLAWLEWNGPRPSRVRFWKALDGWEFSLEFPEKESWQTLQACKPSALKQFSKIYTYVYKESGSGVMRLKLPEEARLHLLWNPAGGLRIVSFPRGYVWSEPTP